MKKGDRVIYIVDHKYATLLKDKEYIIDKVINDKYIKIEESIAVHNVNEFIRVH